MIISPDHALTIDELRQTLGLIAVEHRIASDAPRAVVQHDKGLRPAHFHVAYSIVDAVSGRAIKSHGNYERDELISRLLEIQFGERIVPGPRLAENIAVLRTRGMDREAEILALHQPHKDPDPLDRNNRQQASRLDVNPVAWSANVYRIFEDAGRKAADFKRMLGPAGLKIAQGDRATLIVDDATGHHDSLVRLLRREAKKKGRLLRLREEDIRDAFSDAKPFVTVRDEGLRRAQDRAQTAADREWSRLLDEASVDADRALATYRAERRREAAEADARDRAWFSATLKARREAIVATYRARDRIRRERVDRLFRVARILDNPLARRTTFALAATGMLLAGTRLAAAIAGAGLAVAVLPTLNRARASARRAREARAQDAVSRRTDLARSYADVRRANSRTPRDRRGRFNFNDSAKGDRILAGVVAQAVVSGRPLAEQSAAANAAIALGPVLVGGITDVLARGSIFQSRRLLNWCGPAASRDQALAAALRRHAAAAVVPEPTKSPAGPIPTTVGLDQDHARTQTGSDGRDPAPTIGPKPAGVGRRSADQPSSNRKIVADETEGFISGFSPAEVKIKPRPPRVPTKPPQDNAPLASRVRSVAGQAQPQADTSNQSKPAHDRRLPGSRSGSGRGGGSEIGD